MQLTKYTHATVALERDGVSIVIDPGAFTTESADLVGAAAAVLITHEHQDHLDVDAVLRGVAANPDVIVYGPQDAIATLGADAQRVRVVAAGDEFTVGPFSIRVFGDTHAQIHRDIPLIQNVGYLVDGRVFHPGDAYLVPGVPVETLLVPTSGPWTSTGATIDYVREVAPARAVQIHESLLSELGQRSTVGMLGEGGLGRVPTEILVPGQSIEV